IAATTAMKVKITTASPTALAISSGQLTSTLRSSGVPDPALRPFERAFPPRVGQADHQDDEKDQHLHERKLAQLAEDDGPGIQVDDLDVKNHEDETEQIVAHIELRPGLTEGHDARFIGHALLGK